MPPHGTTRTRAARRRGRRPAAARSRGSAAWIWEGAAGSLDGSVVNLSWWVNVLVSFLGLERLRVVHELASYPLWPADVFGQKQPLEPLRSNIYIYIILHTQIPIALNGGLQK